MFRVHVRGARRWDVAVADGLLRRGATAMVVGLLASGCGGARDRSAALTADVPLHLENHLDVASVTVPDLPPSLPEPRTERENMWLQPDFEAGGEYIYANNDGAVHTYLLRADWGPDWMGGWSGGPVRQLGLQFGGVWPEDRPEEGPAIIEILSISVIPKGAEYAGEPFGVRTEVRDRSIPSRWRGGVWRSAS